MAFYTNFGNNQKLIEKYLSYREANNKSYYTIKNERVTLNKLSDFLKKDFREIQFLNTLIFLLSRKKYLVEK